MGLECVAIMCQWQLRNSGEVHDLPWQWFMNPVFIGEHRHIPWLTGAPVGPCTPSPILELD